LIFLEIKNVEGLIRNPDAILANGYYSVNRMNMPGTLRKQVLDLKNKNDLNRGKCRARE
jgi:hypothetical protein